MLAVDPAVFAALGDRTRLQLLAHLSDGDALPIRSLTETTRVTRQAVTKHLGVLEGAGLVSAERVGRERRFRIRREGFEPAQAYLAAIAQQWDDALARLERHVTAVSQEGDATQPP